MENTVEALAAEVLKLSREDRSRLLDRLVASLDQDLESEQAWDAVADEREAQLACGTARAVPLDEVLSQLESKYVG